MSISDERGLIFDRNAIVILLKSRFLNPMNMKTHFWLLLVLRYIEVACSVHVALPYIIFIFTQTIEQTIVSVCTSGFLAFFLFFFYYVVCKQVERLPLLVIKTMTLKSQTNIQITRRQQDARICSCSPNYFGQPIKTWRKTFLKLF